jgi:hypothetical protein
LSGKAFLIITVTCCGTTFNKFMANVDIKFRNFANDTEKSIEAYVPEMYPSGIYIVIRDDNSFSAIILDKATAVRFVRELKKQISLTEPF